MSSRDWFSAISFGFIGLLLVVFMIAMCHQTPPEPSPPTYTPTWTPTPTRTPEPPTITPEPPTATATPKPPTATPTATQAPPTATPTRVPTGTPAGAPDEMPTTGGSYVASIILALLAILAGMTFQFVAVRMREGR